jgi:ergothioneine biosynthesis protein EgtB
MIYKCLVIATFEKIRGFTEKLCKPLMTEDYVIQSMPDVSPPKWHLAHTTWFFENFILSKWIQNYQPVCPDYFFLFNSYYKTVGEHFTRSQRGLLSRPSVEEIYQYRKIINERICQLLAQCSERAKKELVPLMTLGIHHEQQHQELLLTDILHIFWINPLKPSYLKNSQKEHLEISISPHSFLSLSGGLLEMGHPGDSFSFDNELPRHRVFLDEFQIGNRLVTQGEYLEFMEAGGYQKPELWLSDGWICVEKYQWRAPLYWEKIGTHWWQMTLFGMQRLQLSCPVSHISYYEAEAFAKWKAKRLPTEAEWETCASTYPIQGNFVEQELFCPQPLSHRFSQNGSIHQLYGDLWEWTASPYQPYPGFKPLPGSIGEYNGKFMCNQMILRGGSFGTSETHIRPTYRNFFPPDTRWQFTGFRLAGDR